LATLKHLVVMRHAEAEHGHGDDHARALTARGHSQALQAGQWAAALGFVPAAFVVSDAVRTRQTMEDLGLVDSFRTEPDAYNATAQEICEFIWALPDTVNAAIVVAHNPGISDLCSRLGHLSVMRPACAVLVNWEGEWRDFLDSACSVVATFVPNTQ
jgi:phosphohistidine phosphatase